MDADAEMAGVWETTWASLAPGASKALAARLADGWEPFAVSDNRMHFRRFVPTKPDPWKVARQKETENRGWEYA